jgi:hypothetical protein
VEKSELELTRLDPVRQRGVQARADRSAEDIAAEAHNTLREAMRGAS